MVESTPTLDVETPPSGGGQNAKNKRGAETGGFTQRGLESQETKMAYERGLGPKAKITLSGP